MGQAAASSVGCSQTPACVLQPGGAVSGEFALPAMPCAARKPETLGTHFEGGPTRGLQQVARWANTGPATHIYVHCTSACAFQSALVAIEADSSADVPPASCLVTTLFKKVLLLQAVEDMCLHKMADKLYHNLQQVKLWRRDCWL